MTLSLILAHPDPASLAHALARSALEALEERGHDVRFHDLHAEGFDPRLTAAEIATHRSDDPLIERHAAELVQADGLVIVHPIWFDLPPAVLKGWVDRVVREGTAFEHATDGGFRSLTRLRAALLVTSANAPYDDAVGDGSDRFWRDLVLPTCGVRRVERLHFTPVVTRTLAVRRAWLEEVAATAEATFD